MSIDPEHLRNHWWWRPGWQVGRRFYTWHLTFHEDSEVHRMMSAYRAILADLDGLDLIPDRWLHLTMQGLGFTDEVSEDDVSAIVEAAQSRLAQQPVFEIALRSMSVTPEAVEAFAEPAEPVREVRNAIRQAIGDVWSTVPEDEDGFTPHVSVAYSSADRSAAPVIHAVQNADIPPASARVRSADLIVLHRDNYMYEWDTFAKVPLG